MRGDRTGLGEHHAAFDFIFRRPTEQHADVIACLGRIEQLSEHFNVGGHGFARVLQPDNFDFCHPLQLAAFYTTGNDGPTTFNREHIFDAHQKRLVHFARRERDEFINSVEQLLYRFLTIGLVVHRLFSTASDYRGLIARELVFVQQVANFHFNEVQQLRIVNEVNLVEEHHDSRNAHLAGQQNVFARLRHRTFGGIDNKNSPVHLGSASNHVFDKVSVSWAIDMGVMPFVTLIFHVRNRDCHRLGFVTDRAAFSDIGV